MKKITLKNYYKHFVSIYGALTVLVGALPLAAFFEIDKKILFLFPPIGDIKKYISVISVVIVIVVTFVIYFQKDRECVKKPNGSANLSLIFAALIGIFMTLHYIAFQNFVESVYFRGELIYVSKGYARQPDKVNDQRTDLELIKNQGIEDADLKKIWMPNSIYIARFTLFITYFLVILSVVALLSFAVLFDLLKVSGVSEKSPKP